MRDIIFEEIGMENFGPYIEPMVLTIKDNSLVLITGPNGVGKTMSLEALPFTLYGVTNKGAKGDDVINNVTGKNCKTWVKFASNEDKYKITRYHKYTKLQNTVILNKNGVDIKKGHKEVLPVVEKLICPKKTFTNTLMFGQKVKDFFTDLLDSDKKDIFRKILNLDMYTLYYKETKKKLDELVEKLNENKTSLGIKEGLLADTVEQIKLLKQQENNFYKNIENDIKTLQKSLEENQRLLQSWERELKNIQQEDFDITLARENLNSIISQLQTIESNIRGDLLELDNQKSKKIEELRNKAINTERDIQNQYEQELSGLRDEKQKINNDFQEILQQLTNEKHKIDLEEHDILSTQSHLEERINEIQVNVINSDNSECPLCEQSVTEETRTILEKKVVVNQDKLKETENKLLELADKKKGIDSQIEKERNDATNKTNEIEEKIQQTENTKQLEVSDNQQKLQEVIQQVNDLAEQKKQSIQQETKETINRLNNEKSNIEEQIQEYNNSLEKQEEAKNKIQEIKTNINNNEAEIKRKSNEQYDDSQVKSYLSKRVSLLDELEHLKQLTQTYSERKEILEFWKNAFSANGMPSMLIDEAIPFMNQRVKHYLDKITNGRYIVSFDTLDSIKSGEFRDKISVNVIDTHTRANSRIQLSGGQTRIIDIATILTLCDLQSDIQDVRFNLLLFDEIFDSLDDENIGYVSKVLTHLKQEKSIYLISHKHEDQLEADEVFTYF